MPEIWLTYELAALMDCDPAGAHGATLAIRFDRRKSRDGQPVPTRLPFGSLWLTLFDPSPFGEQAFYGEILSDRQQPRNTQRSRALWSWLANGVSTG